MDFFQNKTVQIIIVVVIVVIILYFILPKRNDYVIHNENFGNQQIPLEVIYEDPIIKPTYIDDNGTIMSGTNFIPQKEISPAWGEQYGVEETIDNNELSDGKGGSYTLSTNICSPSCCSNQYPVPFKLKDDRFVCNNKDELLPSNYVCNNSWQNAGCMCITKDQKEMIFNRGNNA